MFFNFGKCIFFVFLDVLDVSIFTNILSIKNQSNNKIKRQI